MIQGAHRQGRWAGLWAWTVLALPAAAAHEAADMSRVHLVLEGAEDGLWVREILHVPAPDGPADRADRRIALPEAATRVQASGSGTLAQDGQVIVRASRDEPVAVVIVDYLVPWDGNAEVRLSQTLDWPVGSASLVWGQGSALDVSGRAWTDRRLVRTPLGEHMIAATAHDIGTRPIEVRVRRVIRPPPGPGWKLAVFAAMALLGVAAYGLARKRGA